MRRRPRKHSREGAKRTFFGSEVGRFILKQVFGKSGRHLHRTKIASGAAIPERKRRGKKRPKFPPRGYADGERIPEVTRAKKKRNFHRRDLAAEAESPKKNEAEQCAKKSRRGDSHNNGVVLAGRLFQERIHFENFFPERIHPESDPRISAAPRRDPPGTSCGPFKPPLEPYSCTSF